VAQGAAAQELDTLAERATQEIQQAIGRARAAARPDPAAVLEDVYRSPALQGIAG